MNNSATVHENNTVHLRSGANITINGAMNGNASVRNIMTEYTNHGTVVVNISYGSTTEETVKDCFKLNPSWASKNHIVLLADGTYLKIAKMPSVETVTITSYNSTVVNVSFSLNAANSGASSAWVNLTNISGSSHSHSIQTGAIPADGTNTTQFTGLTPGRSYRLNITPPNASIICGTPNVYTATYTTPLPEIAFESATIWIEITADPLYVANGTSVVIPANITNITWGELKNEAIIWNLRGSGFTESDETIYLYTITLTANAAGNITVKVGDVEKMLNLTHATPSAPIPPVQPPVAYTSSGNMDNAYRLLFETFGGNFISPVVGLSSGDWFTDEDCPRAWDFVDGILGDITFYAKWIAVCLAALVIGTQTQSTGDSPGDTSAATVQSAVEAMTTTAVTITAAANVVVPTLTWAPAPLRSLHLRIAACLPQLAQLSLVLLIPVHCFANIFSRVCDSNERSLGAKRRICIICVFHLTQPKTPPNHLPFPKK